MTEFIQNEINNIGVLVDFVKNAQNKPFVATKFDYVESTHEDFEVEKLYPFYVDAQEASIGDTVSKDPTVNNVPFLLKPVGTGIEISKELNLNNETIKSESEARMPQRFFRTVQNQAFGAGNANGDGLKFQSIVDYNTATVKVNGVSINDTFTHIDDMFEEFSAESENLVDAVIVVNTLADILQFKDGNGNAIFKYGYAEDGRNGTFYGVPVHVQNMYGKAKIVLMNAKAYAVVKTPVEVNEMPAHGGNDTDTARSGHDWLYGENFMDGKVVNPEAIKICKSVVIGASFHDSVEVENPVGAKVQSALVEKKTTKTRKAKGENHG